jgi:hypothetical protein
LSQDAPTESSVGLDLRVEALATLRSNVPKRRLREHCKNLVDEIILLPYPPVIGEGTRLFPDTGQDTALDLVDSRVTHKGVTIQVYRATGRRSMEPPPCDTGARVRESRHPEATSMKLSRDS